MPPEPTPQPLVSIFLAVKTRSGPRLVLHYPPAPSQQAPRASSDADNGGTDGADEDHSSTDESLSEPDDDSGKDWINRQKPINRREYTGETRNDGGIGSYEFGSASADAMARLLTPSSRGWDKRRFELGIDDRIYLGCPMFEREEGGWSRPVKAHDAEHEDGDKEPKTVSTEPQDERGEDVFSPRSPGEADGRDELSRNLSSTQLDSTDDSGTPSRTNSDLASKTASVQVPGAKAAQTRAAAAASRPDSINDFSGSFATTATSDSALSQGSSQNGNLRFHVQTLNMFNLVFVLHHGKGEDICKAADAMYNHVVLRLANALKWTQRRYAWLWSESRTVIGVREKGKENGDSYEAIWPSIASKSLLARVIASVYDGIAAGRMVHLSMGPANGNLSISLHIPRILTTGHAPSPMSHDTTMGMYTMLLDTHAGQEDDHAGLPYSGVLVSPHNALLLLSPASSIIEELAATGAGSTGPLAQFLRKLSPTKTLFRLSRTLKLSLRDVQLLSAHLINYQRALPICPLQPSHTYVVNPNADFSRFDEAAAAYNRRFPTLPSLNTMLARLSGGPAANASKVSPYGKRIGPQPFAALIPSSDHKAMYMECLEWLMRLGWLTQLKTYAWVRVSAEVKAVVAQEFAAEQDVDGDVAVLEEAEMSASGAILSDEDAGTDHGLDATEFKRIRTHSLSNSVAAPAFSPRLKALLGGPAGPSSEAGSTNSARTTVRISTTGLRIPSQSRSQTRGSDRKSSGSQGRGRDRLSDASAMSRLVLRKTYAGEHVAPQPSDFEPSIVLSPHRADALESRWLRYIGESLPTAELRTAWPRLLRHFDGRHALEDLHAVEGWKRKSALPLLTKLMSDDLGVLLTVKHW